MFVEHLAWLGFLLGTGFFAGIGIFLSLGWAVDDKARRGTLRMAVVAMLCVLYGASLLVSEDRLVSRGGNGLGLVVLGALVGGFILGGVLPMYKSRE